MVESVAFCHFLCKCAATYNRLY